MNFMAVAFWVLGGQIARQFARGPGAVDGLFHYRGFEAWLEDHQEGVAERWRYRPDTAFFR